MPETLLRTKLFVPPDRPNLVPCPYLIERRNQALQPAHKLAVISRLDVFGTSTLVTNWLTDSGTQAARLSLEKSDDDSVSSYSFNPDCSLDDSASDAVSNSLLITIDPQLLEKECNDGN